MIDFFTFFRDLGSNEVIIAPHFLEFRGRVNDQVQTYLRLNAIYPFRQTRIKRKGCALNNAKINVGLVMQATFIGSGAKQVNPFYRDFITDERQNTLEFRLNKAC